MVGASKALHFIEPNVFVPWDTKIRSNYHENDPLHSKQHREGTPECYANFMRTCNSVVARITSKRSYEQLAQTHPVYKALRHIRKPSKMLDECNYCWFTKNERWTHT
jgi:hypothetical protein